MMEAGISPNWRVPAATVFSVVLIVGVYLFVRNVESPQLAQASMETALLKAIATKDSDGDGLPDWEESLYGTDPHIVDTFKLGLSDGEAVTRGLIVPKALTDMGTASPAATADKSGIIDPSLPAPAREGTLTAAFAQSFFSLYVAAKQNKSGADLTEAEISEISNQAVATLTASVAAAPDYKSMKDLKIVESTPETFRAYAEQAEAVLMKNTSTATTSEINYLKMAVENGDTSANGHLNSKANAYRRSAAGLAVLPVPKELAEADLLLINTLMRMGGIASDFALADTDPLATIFALQQYVKTLTGFDQAFTNVGKVYAVAGVSLPTGTPGASFVNMVADVETVQAATKKP